MKPKVWLPGEFTPIERAHISFRLALHTAALAPHDIMAVPVLTQEIKDVMEEVVETTAVVVPEAQRLVVVFAH